MDESVTNSSMETDGSGVESRERANSSGTITSRSSTSDYVTGDADDSSEGKLLVPGSLKSTAALLSITDSVTQEDLREMVNDCKRMVLESAECTAERKWLVRRLIELRLRAQELREIERCGSNNVEAETRFVLGHRLIPQKFYVAVSSPTYCDHCGGAVWTMLQSWYKCADCNFAAHWKCLGDIKRVCAHVIASEAGGYLYATEICPEKGLSGQAYRCAECKVKITFESAWIEPRLCDYSGLYYCQRCHWNSIAVIPARVIRNWDTEPRRVCRSSSQILAVLESRPVLRLENLNPKLFSLIPDLTLIKRLRGELQMMKRYLVFCPDADFHGLPWRIGLRSHFIENTDNYSIRDLIDLHDGTLIDEIRSAHDSMRSHISETCELCKARGHLCEICGNDEVIYPWDANVISCNRCSAVYHRVCWSKRNNCCPRCPRIERRQQQDQETFDDSRVTSANITDENSTSDPH